MRPTFKAAVYLLLIKDDCLLLGLRKNTGYKDGQYGLVSGHINRGESLKEAILRESREEAGIELVQNDLNLLDVRVRDDYIDAYFICKKWKGSIKNKEPEKCDSLSFFNVQKLPDNTVSYIKDIVRDLLLECVEKNY